MIKKFHQWEQDILSFPTRKQYNHVSNNLEIITIQARLLEYLNRRPQDTKKKKKSISVWWLHQLFVTPNAPAVK